jgi:hypothetical protein
VLQVILRHSDYFIFIVSYSLAIDVFRNRVLVTWWERNATSDMLIMMASTDNGDVTGDEENHWPSDAW